MFVHKKNESLTSLVGIMPKNGGQKSRDTLPLTYELCYRNNSNNISQYFAQFHGEA